MKSWLQDNDILHSRYNEGKSVASERFIRTYIYDFNIKNAYINKLDHIVNEYNNTYHSPIKIKSGCILVYKIMNLRLLSCKNIKI